MPLAYEYDLDHDLIIVSGWDQITLGDAMEYFEEVVHMPNDLSGCVEYFDLEEVTDFPISEMGAMQLASAYERVAGRGVSGMVLFAPRDNIRETAEMMAFTFSEVAGGFEKGYRAARQPVPPEEVHRFLRDGPDSEKVVSMVA